MSEEESSGTPAWVVTFADLMSLLMCFFVLSCTMFPLAIVMGVFWALPTTRTYFREDAQAI